MIDQSNQLEQEQIIQLVFIISRTNRLMNPKYNALFTSVNLLLGVGPLILPLSYFEGGVLLSTLWMLLIMFISYNSAMYIVEAMSKVAYIDQIQQDDMKNSLITNQSLKSNVPQRKISNTEQSQKLNTVAEPSSIAEASPKTVNSLSQQQLDKKYDHIEQFGILYGYKYKIFPSLIISIYLTGTAISKCIMTGNILSKVFEDVDILKLYEPWLAMFFLSGAAFSFKSIQNTKALQFFIVIARFISIIAMILGSVYIMIKYGVQSPLPSEGGVFNYKNFAQIFSNSLFALMFHHSLPGIAREVKNTTDTSFFIKTAFLISGSTLLIIPITASLAFGEGLQKYYNLPFNKYPQTKFIYYIVSFYVFLNIAAFSVYIIVIRTNIIKVFFPKMDPMKVSRKTITITTILLVIICIVGLGLKQYIQYVLDFTGGVFGSIILFFIPCLEVFSARRKVWKKGEVKNYIEKLPILIMVLGGVFMSFNLAEVINNITNGKP